MRYDPLISIVVGTDDTRTYTFGCCYREFQPTVRYVECFLWRWSWRVTIPLTGWYPIRWEWTS